MSANKLRTGPVVLMIPPIDLNNKNKQIYQICNYGTSYTTKARTVDTKVHEFKDKMNRME